MKYLSVCSGVGTDHVAWAGLGFECVGFAEIEPFPAALLAHHFPSIPNFGDFTRVELEMLDGKPDVLVGGTPCQSFSVAGQRAGLDDPRGNLTLEFARLARRLGVTWIVWENVPGVLSSGDFGAIISTFQDCGYSVCWRVLDAQHFGVPQRRRRVFIVGYLGDQWELPAQVLLEQGSVPGDSPKGREKGQEVAGTLGGGSGSRGWSSDLDRATFIPVQLPAISGTVTTTWGAKNATNHEEACSGALIHGYVPEVAPCLLQDCGTKLREDQSVLVEGTWWDGSGVAATIDATSNDHRMPDKGRFSAVLQSLPSVLAVKTAHTSSNGIGVAEDVAYTLDRAQGQAVALSTVVRRLTPRECERLQGLPDDWTLVPWRGKPAPDGPRYKAIGNGMAVPVVKWIGQRLMAVQAIAGTRRF